MAIYAVSPLAQKEQVDSYCFKECGQIIIGGIEIMGAPFCPCRTIECPYLDKEMNLGEAEFTWGKEEVVVRELQEFPKAEVKK